LVHESDPDDFDERDERDAYRRGRGDARIRPERRGAYEPARRGPSVFVRVLRTTALGVVLVSVAFVAYLAGQARMLDPVLPRGLSTAVATQAAPPSKPQPVAAAQPAPVPTLTAQQPAQPPAAPAQGAVPDVPILAMLVRNAVIALHQANVTDNYAVLLALGAPPFQQGNTPDSLAKAFTGLRAANLDLNEVATASPNLYRPAVIDKNGLLQLAGFIPIGAARVDFEMSFLTVSGRWRLFAIGVHPPAAGSTTVDKSKAKAKAPTAKDIPPDPQLIGLIRTSVAALNQANVTGDYSVLHDLGSANFQKANPPEKLSHAFANIRSRGLDLAPTAVIDPRLFQPATIDDNGYLRLAGYFPSRPEQVNFDLVFQFERGAWRLFGIGVDSARDPAALATSP
jgi:hypothetical protein